MDNIESKFISIVDSDTQDERDSKNIFLFYPPGKLYQRGEDRSQGNIDQSSATAMRAPNDMAYASSSLKKRGHRIFFRDYQSEKLTINDLINDFITFSPEIVAISTTNSTIFDDLEILTLLREKKTTLTILKGAIFFNPKDELLQQMDLTGIDYLVGGEFEFTIDNLIDAHFNQTKPLSKIRGILYKQNGHWCKSNFDDWEQNVDSIPYPDRNIINNSLYARPDTGEAQATIATSRGCPSSCTYCLTPIISGKKVRYRSPDNILAELLDCYHNHSIRNFFFKSDTFTINHEWVFELCTKIIESELNGKIQWVANSRVRPLKYETLEIMKQAGCWLIAFGFESGSEETLKNIKKGATVEDNQHAVALAKKAGLKIFGFFMIGLPWEDITHLNETKTHIFDLDCDFMELHIAVPYYGTQLYHDAVEANLLKQSVLGTNYFNESTSGTKYISAETIVSFQRKLILRYHSRPSYIFKKLCNAITQPTVLKNYFSFGIRLLKNNIPALIK